MTSGPERPRVLAVASGKGGVGKTNVAVNLAICLRMFGEEVLLLDADVSLANVDVLLGLDVQRSLRDALLDGQPIEHVVVDGPRGLRILPGASGVVQMTRLDDERLSDFLGRLERYCAPMGFIVVDTSPGISAPVIDCLMAADETLLVTNPEPTSLTDAYALLKVMSRRRGGRDKRVWVIMNQVRSKEAAVRSFDRLRRAAERFLRLEVEYLGSVSEDGTVSEATMRQVDFLTHYAESPCTRDLRKVAARLVSAARAGGGASGRFFRRVMRDCA